MNTIDYFGINITINQEPTDQQIRQLMDIANIDYYTAQEELRLMSYGDPPKGFDSWAEYKYKSK